MDLNYTVVPAIIVAFGALIAGLSLRRILSLRAKPRSGQPAPLQQIVLSCLAIGSLCAAAISGFNAIQLHRFRAHPPGEFHIVNGHRMRIDCLGSGSPTLILDAGLGNDGLIWGGVQPELAKTTRVCSFDRAGFGWSDPLPTPRDAAHITAELHGLLTAAGIDNPIVLMGHSIAGLYIRDYATQYPAQVAGLIFIDASSPLQDRDPAFIARAKQEPPAWFSFLRNQAAFALGIPRMFGQCSRHYPGFGPHASHLQAENACRRQFAASAAEASSFDQSGQQTLHTGPYGALPVLILSEDPEKQNPRMADVTKAWNLMQEDLKSLSTRSRRILAKGSSHYVQLDRPDLIEKEVPQFIQQIRAAAPQPGAYGSTTIE